MDIRDVEKQYFVNVEEQTNMRTSEIGKYGPLRNLDIRVLGDLDVTLDELAAVRNPSPAKQIACLNMTTNRLTVLPKSLPLGRLHDAFCERQVASPRYCAPHCKQYNSSMPHINTDT